jgi:copper chaperone
VNSSDQLLALDVLGMSCGHCKATIELALHRLPGVYEVNVDLEAKRVIVRGQDLDPAQIREAIDEAGYVVKK